MMKFFSSKTRKNRNPQLLGILSLLFLLPIMSVCQNNALILNDGVVLSISGGAVLTVDQPHSNGIITSGAGTSYIQSEGELNRVAWNINNSTGNYTIPFGVGGVRMDAAYNITSAGSSPGTLVASTYPTVANNTSYPSVAPAVTNIDACYPAGACQNRSLYAVDRFLILRKLNWASNPTSNITFGYRDAELAGPNTITEANLGAQYWDVNQWLPGWFTGPAPLGTVDALNNRVSGIDAGSNGNFYTWILVDKSNPLPVELIDFDAFCNDENPVITWTTASEINNNYFTLERSSDSQSWETVTVISGAGNSNSTLMYQFSDIQTSNAAQYYRLWQQDFDGTTELLGNIQINCSSMNHSETFEMNIYSDQENQIHLTFYAEDAETYFFSIFDIRGRLIGQKEIHPVLGTNHVIVSDFLLNEAVYMVQLTGKSHSMSQKVHLH